MRGTSLQLISCALAWLLTACAATPPTSLPANTERVGDGVYLFQHGGHRSLFIVTSAGVIVTDPLNATAAREYKNAITALTDQPVKYVVYSHYHWDRVSGAEVFTADGAEVVAQERCAERFVDNPDPAVVMPDITFGDRHRLALGSRSLELYYFGPSHGDCLSVFVAQPAGLMQVVDLVEPPRAAFPADRNVPYVRPHNLRQFFAATIKMAETADVSMVLASHAPSPVTAPVSIISDQARFWNAIYDAVETARDKGNIGIDSVVKLKTIDTAPFEPFDGYRKEDLPVIMRRFVGFYDMGR